MKQRTQNFIVVACVSLVAFIPIYFIHDLMVKNEQLNQRTLPSEHLTPLDRKIAEKLNVLEMCVDDIRKLLHQKASSDI